METVIAEDRNFLMKGNVIHSNEMVRVKVEW